jgi:hypothetical protein
VAKRNLSWLLRVYALNGQEESLLVTETQEFMTLSGQDVPLGHCQPPWCQGVSLLATRGAKLNILEFELWD